MAPFPKWHPDAIDVTGPVPVNGKPWYGGSGNRKLILHTIEGGADPWTIGWPRYWPNVRSAPHFYLNSDRWPDRDWLYQTLPLDVAGYALRSNATEDDKYVWQVEIAGQAAKTPGYPDSFYQAIAELCDWFVAECGVADVVFDIQRPHDSDTDGPVLRDLRASERRPWGRYPHRSGPLLRSGPAETIHGDHPRATTTPRRGGRHGPTAQAR